MISLWEVAGSSKLSRYSGGVVEIQTNGQDGAGHCPLDEINAPSLPTADSKGHPA